METTATENSQPSFSSNAPDPHLEDPDQNLINHGDEGKKQEIIDEEVREIVEVIATTGKFWHEWDTLKSLLSFQLKQVLSEYPEAKMANDQQSSLLGETHAELVKRLDEVLLSFVEGPPFTLQRLCEILLAAQSIYPNLSKLALALEKNLSVTSTLSMSTDPYPSMKQRPSEPANGNEDLQDHSYPIQNGVEGTTGDGDEEMVEAEVEAEAEAEAEAEEVEEDNKDSNMETTGEMMDGTQETSSDGSTNSEPSTESSPSSEQVNSTGS